jgi:hypothetical protein
MRINRIVVAKTVAYLIAAVAAVSSFGHQVHLLSLADLDPLFGYVPSEWVTPLTVDSLAIVALMVRMSPEATPRSRNLALIPLGFAGAVSIAANVATARNVVQVIVGIWTVAAYVLAELFVGMIERKATPVASTPTTPARVWVITQAEKDARKRAGYDKLDRAAKAEWTRKYRERVSRRMPTSGAGVGPTTAAVPSLDELAEAVA